MEHGCAYGTHRVIEPAGVLPQAAWKIDNTMDIRDNEILIKVQTLNIDSASFTQIRKEADDDEARISEVIMGIVAKRGKHHNPVTGSGGMLIGTVEAIGDGLAGKIGLRRGDRIATLVSLSLTPLVIDEITRINKETDQVDIEGHAILFESGIYAVLPDDLPDNLSLAVLDVAGAPAQTARLVKPGDTVVVIGAGGKSGLLCLYEAKKRAGVTGTVIAVEYSEVNRNRIQQLGLADVVLGGDATHALEIYEEVSKVTAGRLADVTINVVNIPGTEMASVLSTRERGLVYFFSMATSFTAAALGAEGAGKDVDMMIGNGYTAGHARIALEVLRECPKLRKLFEELYAR